MRWALQSPWISAWRHLLDHVMEGGSLSSWTCQLGRQRWQDFVENTNKGGVLQISPKISIQSPWFFAWKKLYTCGVRLEETRQKKKKKKNQLERNKLDSYWSAHRVGWHQSSTWTSLNTRGIELSWRPWMIRISKDHFSLTNQNSKDRLEEIKLTHM